MRVQGRYGESWIPASSFANKSDVRHENELQTAAFNLGHNQIKPQLNHNMQPISSAHHALPLYTHNIRQ